MPLAVKRDALIEIRGVYLIERICPGDGVGHQPRIKRIIGESRTARMDLSNAVRVIHNQLIACIAHDYEIPIVLGVDKSSNGYKCVEWKCGRKHPSVSRGSVWRCARCTAQGIREASRCVTPVRPSLLVAHVVELNENVRVRVQCCPQRCPREIDPLGAYGSTACRRC